MQRNRGKQQNGKRPEISKIIRDAKGIFHAKMGTRKERSGMDLKKQKI